MARQSCGMGLVTRFFVVLAGVGAPLSSCGLAAWGQSQIILVNTAPANGASGQIDRRYAQVEPTHVALQQTPLDARGHQELLRTLTAEQGFAMRPLPRGKKGLTLAANGPLTPFGAKYVEEVSSQGLSVKPGDRVVLSNLRIDKDRLVFDINGGPERKHDFLRHVQVGVGGPNMTQPIVQDPGQEPVGSRVTLMFAKFVPDVTPAQVKALLAPLISFDVKTPVQAYTDTLPPQLKSAILNHHVLVGMSTDMVLFAMGQPESKSREIEGQMPFEEWIYGQAPRDVQFVRINGNRVIRLEIAKIGQPLEVFTKNEVEGLMTTDGKPVLAEATLHDSRTVRLGDAHRDADRQAPAAPPTLRAPGEKLPEADTTRDAAGRDQTMKPVVFPKDTTHQPARTVPAHPAPASPEGDDNAASAGGQKPVATAPKAVESGSETTGTAPQPPSTGPER